MALHLHRAERTDALADGLARLLADPLPDPFASELVLVPAKGVERWLSQRLSHVLGAGPTGDGVCAAVRFRNPVSLVAELTGAADDDPWSPDTLAWPVLQALDEVLDEPWARTLAQHLGHGDTGPEAELRQGRRFGVARRLAGLFASYAVQRPQVLQDWLTGEDSDGLGVPIAPDLAWQPPLWRRVCDLVDAPPPHERHAATLARLRETGGDLPPRLSVFGSTRLAATEVELLTATAVHHDLHLWVPHPSDRQWRRLVEERGRVPRHHDHAHRRLRHPLLITLGRDLRELQRGLAVVDPAPVVDEALPGPTRPDTLLGWLQSDLAADEVRPEGRVLAPDDRSVQVHRCHGPARQVEVLREVLLGLLQDDPTLEPRDILVMCPDIETYAPLLTASFGLGDVADAAHPGHRLEVRLADRSPSRTNPLLDVAARLLELAGGRATASEVLDLATVEPVRRRFGFSDDDLETITRWVGEAGVRWGFDPEHRAAWGLGPLVHNTWRFGLDRVLTGVALSDDSGAWLGQALPLDDVGSTSIDLAGRLAEYVDRLAEADGHLTGPQPLTQWTERLTTAVAALARVTPADAWQVGHLRRELTKVLTAAGDRGTLLLRLPDVRALLAGHLAGRPTRANFRTGTLTVCTMVPMRSVPHRVVCLVGLDDGVFPRHGVPDGDDLLAREPVTGERDVRAEDRQLLLDALAATTDRLVVTYTGANAHTGQPRPPAVPLGELLDALDRTTTAPVRDQVVVRHPLQPFDLRNVEPGRLGVPGPFTFDPALPRAARAAASDRPPDRGVLGTALDPDVTADVTLPDLLSFFRDPIGGFFRALDVTLPWEVETVRDDIPVSLDQLERWGVGDRLLTDMLALVHPDVARGREWRRGSVPPGRLGWRTVTEVRDQAMEIARLALTHRQAAPRSHDIEVDLGGGRRLTGTVGPVYGDRLVSAAFSRLGPKPLLASWIQLLALAATLPDHNWTALVVGRGAGSSAAQRLLGPATDEPLGLLRDLVAIRDAGRRAPLPLPLKTSFEWAQMRRLGRDPAPEAAKKWLSRAYPGEQDDRAAVRVWGPHAPLDVLVGPAGPDETHPGESTRLGAWSMRLWTPLLDAERGPV